MQVIPFMFFEKTGLFPVLENGKIFFELKSKQRILF